MFNYMNVGFVQNRTYDEKIHAKELGYGMRNCVMTATDFEFDAINHRVGWGRAIMGGTPVRLGSTGEYFDLPVNYSGPVTLKRVLNGNASTIEMITTEPAGNTDSVYYFKLYDIALGAVTQDYRSIEWVHSFFLKNMGGSNIAWVLNGFTSETFDASVLAGNRTLINDKDIGYDDTIHGASALEDILLDIFTKSQTSVGNDKPFIVEFITRSSSAYNVIFGTKLFAFISEKNGVAIPPTELVTFKMEVNTANGTTSSNYTNTNKCSVWCADFYFEFDFEYDNWVNVKVKDDNIDFIGLQAQNAGNFIRKITETADEVIINMIGDSLTRGYDIVNGTDETYIDDNGESKITKVVDISIPERIEIVLNSTHDNVFTVINSGWSGDTANGSAGRWFLDKNEDLTTIMLGTNDDSGNVPFDEYFRDIEIQIKRRLTFGSAVVLMIPPHRLERGSYGINGYIGVLEKLSVKYGIPLIDMREVISQFDYRSFSDATHFNQDGYNQIGWKISSAFINGNIFSKYQTISSGDTVTFFRGEHSHSTTGVDVWSNNYPTKKLDDANIGTALDNAKGISLSAGEEIYLPVFLEEKNLLCIPQIYAGSMIAGEEINVTRGAFAFESVDNVYNYVNNAGLDQLDPPFNMYPRYLSPITSDFFNYRSDTVFCLRGCVITNTTQGSMINFPNKGWNLIKITNDTTSNITVHAVDFIGQYEYYALTGQPPIAYSAPSLLEENND